jgi:hypothetical protein
MFPYTKTHKVIAMIFSMKKLTSLLPLLRLTLLTTCFILLPLTFALPFQEPISGAYQCFVAGQNPFAIDVKDAGATLELHPDSTYTLSTATTNERGTLQTKADDVIDSLGGIFQAGTGLTLSSPNAAYDAYFLVGKQGGSFIVVSLTDGSYIRCESPGADMNAALYGGLEVLANEPRIPESDLLPATTKAPLPPAGTGGLSGLYFYEDEEGEYIPTFANGVSSGYFEFHNEYLYFMPNGYVYRGVYEWSYEALDCSRVTISNSPLCETYVIANNTITFNNYTSSFSKEGNDLVVDGRLYKLLQPADGLKFDGRFLFAQFDGYTLDEAFYTFAKDGTFKVESSSSNNATASVGNTTTYSSSYSETPVTFGKYSVRNNTIEFLYDDGTSLKRVFHFETGAAGQVEYIYINGTIYSRE